MTQKQGAFIIDNGPEVTSTIISGDTVGEPIKVAPKNDLSTYYQFNITAFGWYNIDEFVDKIEGYKQSKLSAKVSGKYNHLTNIFLIIPSSKSFTAGGLLDGETDVYGFYTIDGTLSLPQGKEAYIMAFSEKGDKITFGVISFVTGLNNEITVTPEIITKEVMNQRIKELNFEDLKIQANDSKNADSIRKIDVNLKNIESLKPKGLDCDCGMQDYEVDTSSMSE